jgi:Uma2 family endonuclease
MSVLPSQPNEPTPVSVVQYHDLVRDGLLDEDDPVELLEGLLVRKLPTSPSHTTGRQLVRRAVERVLSPGWHYVTQDPVTLGDGEPEPDGAVVRGHVEDYLNSHPGPGDVALVIEVSDSRLGQDRGIKLRSYARAGIPIYWIVNLLDRQVEVYEEPTGPAEPEPNYRRHETCGPGERLPLLLRDGPTHHIPVADLLPPA